MHALNAHSAEVLTTVQGAVMNGATKGEGHGKLILGESKETLKKIAKAVVDKAQRIARKC